MADIFLALTVYWFLSRHRNKRLTCHYSNVVATGGTEDCRKWRNSGTITTPITQRMSLCSMHPALLTIVGQGKVGLITKVSSLRIRLPNNNGFWQWYSFTPYKCFLSLWNNQGIRMVFLIGNNLNILDITIYVYRYNSIRFPNYH